MMLLDTRLVHYTMAMTPEAITQKEQLQLQLIGTIYDYK